MNAAWFKQQMKVGRVTAEDVASAAGRHRSNVSHIFSGNQRMSLDWAKAFATTLNQPLDEVLRHAGVLDRENARQIAHMNAGFSDGDAAPFAGQGGQAEKTRSIASALGGDRPGVDIWTVRGTAMILGGLLPGDEILIDTHLADRARAGDVVIAQHYDAQSGSAKTLLRRFEPPVLVAASIDPDHLRTLVVDGRNVVIRGVVVGSWRRRADAIAHTQV